MHDDYRDKVLAHVRDEAKLAERERVAAVGDLAAQTARYTALEKEGWQSHYGANFPGKDLQDREAWVRRTAADASRWRATLAWLEGVLADGPSPFVVHTLACGCESSVKGRCPMHDGP